MSDLQDRIKQARAFVAGMPLTPTQENTMPQTYDALLEAYLASLDAAKQADEAKEALRLQVMALSLTATSERFSVKVSESTSERLEGLKAIADKSPSLLAALHSAGCVKTVTSTRLTVKPL